MNQGVLQCFPWKESATGYQEGPEDSSSSVLCILMFFTKEENAIVHDPLIQAPLLAITVKLSIDVNSVESVVLLYMDNNNICTFNISMC